VVLTRIAAVWPVRSPDVGEPEPLRVGDPRVGAVGGVDRLLHGGVEPVELIRTGGRSKFENVSKDLLYVDACITYDAINQVCTAWDQVPLFSDENDQYFWSYDNQGLKLAQLRFYEVPTTTPW